MPAKSGLLGKAAAMPLRGTGRFCETVEANRPDCLDRQFVFALGDQIALDLFANGAELTTMGGVVDAMHYVFRLSRSDGGIAIRHHPLNRGPLPSDPGFLHDRE
ncbi:hypothetical protein [Aliiruegeria sabulilitoris]|uniref:hypothetical protein n=1 Tax=Aliiruegeria sabulilitoris TaxID=1510458 RepID=UPI0012E35CED|nr:hypothetical protein [Aliiruegeria sabulilitoris]NDR58516.1 hypothetical protein [Pseudoruegeria sp. M32A2M]